MIPRLKLLPWAEDGQLATLVGNPSGVVYFGSIIAGRFYAAGHFAEHAFEMARRYFPGLEHQDFVRLVLEGPGGPVFVVDEYLELGIQAGHGRRWGTLPRDLVTGPGEKPHATVTPTVYVEIRRSQPDAPERLYRDDGTVAAFLDWEHDTGIYPLRGTSSCGPGFFVGVFEAEHEEAIRGWLTERGLVGP